MPAYMVVPPESTTLAYRSLRMSTSHFMIELYVVSCTPGDSMPRNVGWKSASGQRKRSLPMVITCPSGSSYDFSSADDDAAVCISWSKSSATYASFSLMSRTISRSAVEAQDRVRQRVALVDGHGVRDAVTRVHHDAGGAARGVQREHGLDGDVHGRDVEGLEHDLRHLLAVGLRVERRLGEEDGVLLGGDAELVVEGAH